MTTEGVTRVQNDLIVGVAKKGTTDSDMKDAHPTMPEQEHETEGGGATREAGTT